MSDFFFPSWPMFKLKPQALTQIQGDFMREYVELLQLAKEGKLGAPADRRFRGAHWENNQSALLGAHLWELSSRTLNRMVDEAEVPEAVRNRLRFSVMQWLEASCPTNFLATNPEVQQLMLETGGQSLARGMANFMEDLGKGRLSQTDESQFELGKNVAITEGSVIYQNPYMQLIQYAPLTPQVFTKPLVIVPPCINKYYILDLQPENSFVRYAVAQGHTVFLVSWRNPLPTDTDEILRATWLDYLEEGVLTALRIASEVTRQPKVNALGFCVGGTMLSCSLALAQARGEKPVESLTLLTTLLDFADTGVLDVFITETHIRMRELQLGSGGLMPARDLATTFSFLRPGELVWNYVVNNYLKGQTPPAFDLLFWNSDGTNLPGPYYTWYLRNCYLENKLSKPGGVVLDGQPIDLSALDMPAYLYASRDDHIVPWKSAYASCGVLSGERRFVMGASGHIAGVINPPVKNRRSYWTSESRLAPGQEAPRADEWLETASEHAGSWWPDWASWLQHHAGEKRKAPSRQGNTQYPVLEAAPGSYVRVRAL